MGIVISINKQLRDSYENYDDVREKNYKKIQIGEPLIMQYCRFFLNSEDLGNNNQLLISTFRKKEELRAGSEAFNYYNPKQKATDGKIDMSDFGGENYGHNLCYYTKSYLGESIFFTTKIVEADRGDWKILNDIQGGITSFGSLPILAQYLPYLTIIDEGFNLFTKLIKYLDKDDIIYKQPVDLHFNKINLRQLQSGRYVLVKSMGKKEIIDTLKLENDNRLYYKKTNKPFIKSSYFVIRINSEEHQQYDNFDYHQDMAAMIETLNRKKLINTKDIIEDFVNMYQSYNDIKTAREIKSNITKHIILGNTSPDNLNYIQALYSSLSAENQALHASLMKELKELKIK